MSTLRRLFSAPGNARVWLSLAFYISALAAVLIYADRIGRKAADAFQQLTAPPDAGPGPEPVTPAEQARVAAMEPAGQREARLLALSRQGNQEATRTLERLVRQAKAPTISPALAIEARGAIEQGTRAERTVAAGLLLAHAGIAIEPASLKGLATALRGGRGRTGKKRLEALERLGWLGFWGLRSGGAEREALRLLRRAKDLDTRAAAARALGRIGDAAFMTPLLRRVHDREAAKVRAGAVFAIVDLGLTGGLVRSRILRALAAAIADRDVSGEHAENVWLALRTLAAEGRRPESLQPEAATPSADGGAPAQ